MKYYNKLMVFFLFLLFSYGVDTFSHTYTIFNETYKDWKVQLYYTFFGPRKLGHARIIKSAGEFRFSFTDIRVGLCLTKIVVWEKDSAGKWVKGKRLLKHSGLCESEAFDLRLNSFGELVAVRYRT